MDTRWQLFDLGELPGVMAPYGRPWWLAGGRGLDAFVGRATRVHGDTDVLVLRRDQTAMRASFASWDLWVASGGALRPWIDGAWLGAGQNSIWCRENAGAPWTLQLLLGDADGDQWIYRRDPRVVRALDELGVETSVGMPVLAPEVQLLFKARDLRARDVADFASVRPALDAARCGWLRDALEVANPGHRWIERL